MASLSWTSLFHAPAWRRLRTRRRFWLLLLGAALLLALLGLLAWRALRPKSERYFELRTAIPESGHGFGDALYQSLGTSLLSGHELELVHNGAVFDALTRDIGRATSSVHLLIYIWERGAASDRISAALVERARHGVACKILVDDFGSPGFREEVGPALQKAGCEVRVFRPVPGYSVLYRNHRKLLVVDGTSAMTGGFGIRDNWLGDGVHGDAWRDTSVRFSGPAVEQAQLAFAESWQEAGGALLPAFAFPKRGRIDPAPDSKSGIAAFIASSGSPELTRAERLLQLMIASAKKRIWIENAYFVPTKGITELLERKAARGVDVRLMVPGKKSDSKTSFGAQQAEFGELIARGVRIFEYQPSMLHSKTMVIDSVLSLVGSINLDPLSLEKLEENALVVEDEVFARGLEVAFTEDCKHANEEH